MTSETSPQTGCQPALAGKKQPNSRNCFGCGVENDHGLKLTFYEVGADQVIADYSIAKPFEGYPGYAHGGVVATLLDETAARAAIVGQHNRLSMTAKLCVRYRKPVPVEEPVRLLGLVRRRRGRVTVCGAELQLSDGSLAAEAEAVLIDAPEAMRSMDELEARGWRVYND